MSKIEGVPQGWKIDCIKHFGGACDENRYIIGYDGNPIKFGDLNNFSPQSQYVFISRDIKIIDMSKCKVDIEYSSPEFDAGWAIAKSRDRFLGNKCNIRVRQNHYFGWQGGECPLPEGLMVRCTYYSSLQGFSQIRSKKNISHRINFLDINLTSFEVLGAAEGYAYKHEIEGGDV